jgi:hypothetical protein
LIFYPLNSRAQGAWRIGLKIAKKIDDFIALCALPVIVGIAFKII